MSSGINLVKEYIAEHPDWQKCTPALSSFLADAFVTDEVLKHALTESVTLGIPHNIYGCKSLDPNKVKALATYLEETRGVSFKSACRAIVTWGVILDKCSTSQTDYLLQQSAVITNSSAISSFPPLSLSAKVCRTIGGLILCVINLVATFWFVLGLWFRFVHGLGFGFELRFLLDVLELWFHLGVLELPLDNRVTFEAIMIGICVYALALFPYHVFLWIFKTNPASPPPSFLSITWRAFCGMLTLIVCIPIYEFFSDIVTLSIKDATVLTMICFYVCQIYVLRWLSPKAARSGESATNNHINKH